MELSFDPPFYTTYKALFDNYNDKEPTYGDHNFVKAEECELPVIDLSQLDRGELSKEKCKREIEKASHEWGFFQVVNHGISREILEKMKRKQVKLFKRPFCEKTQYGFMDFAAGSYRWGTPSPTCISQLSWSEAFHVPLADIISGSRNLTSLSTTMEHYATIVSDLAQKLAGILAEKIGHKSTFFQENCLPNTCYLRMNRYPPCQITPQVAGLMPHTDSDFITILHQDEVGGLQLVKDGKWIAVKPNQDALLINIGDLFQAWSNGVYKSVEHRVVTNARAERFSTAYFMCPSHDTLIESCVEPPLYKSFTFNDYKNQVQDDVKKVGHKIGLPRFLVC